MLNTVKILYERFVHYITQVQQEIGLTSLLVRPPLPHLCSRRVCNKQEVSAPQKAFIRLLHSFQPVKRLTHQVFKLCWQATIVGLLHVHNFCVSTEDVKLSWSSKIIVEHKVRTFSKILHIKSSEVWKFVFKVLPSNCSHITRFPEK